jgi:small-conductance mechanosensitive channel
MIMKGTGSKGNNLAFLGVKQIFLLIPVVLVFAFVCPTPTYPSFWDFWQSEEKKPPNLEEKKPAKLEEKKHPKPSEGIIRESKEKPVTPEKLGMEVQGISNELEYYRKEIEARKKERASLVKQIRTKSKSGRATGPTEEKAKLSKEIEKIDSDMRAKQEIVKDLEKEFLGLQKRLRVLYLSYLYRFLLILGLFSAAYLLNRANRGLLRRMPLEESRRLGVDRLVRIILFVSAAILAIFVGLENLAHVAAVLGLALAGAAIALKDVFLSFIGWLMLVFTRQIKVGDFVESGGISGKVVEINILKTTVLEYKDFQETGRVIFFGNDLIFSQPLFNYSWGKNYVWDKINVYFSHQSDWRSGYNLLLDLLNKKTIDSCAGADGENPEDSRNKKYGIQAPKPVIQTSIDSKGILLSLQYPNDIENFIRKRNEVTEAILNALSQEKNITFA